jgi:hypothetical protein
MTGHIDGATGYCWVILAGRIHLWSYTEVGSCASPLYAVLWASTNTVDWTQQEVATRYTVLELPSTGHTFEAHLLCIVVHPPDQHNNDRTLGLLLSSKEGYLLYWPDVTVNSTLETTINFPQGRSARSSTTDYQVTHLVACQVRATTASVWVVGLHTQLIFLFSFSLLGICWPPTRTVYIRLPWWTV